MYVYIYNFLSSRGNACIDRLNDTCRRTSPRAKETRKRYDDEGRRKPPALDKRNAEWRIHEEEDGLGEISQKSICKTAN